jgi:CBS domain-containing protein
MPASKRNCRQSRRRPPNRRRARAAPGAAVRDGKIDVSHELALHHASRAFAAVLPEQTVAQALASIRSQTIDSPIVCVYVVDEYRRLHGVVSTRRLLTAARDAQLSELMTPAVVTLPLTATMRDAAATLLDHRLLAVPLVGKLGRMHAVVEATTLGGIGVHVANHDGSLRSRLRKFLWKLGRVANPHSARS